VGTAPGLAQYAQPRGVPIGVKRRLRETEIDVGAFAVADQLRRQQVETFVAGESERFRIEHEASAQDGGRNEKDEGQTA
jgi:hypothetical protein